MAFLEGFCQGLKPDPDITITQWADERRWLAKEGSNESGKYRSSRTPWMIEIMDELSPSSPTQEVVAIKPTQMGFTEVGNNLIMAVADIFPGPCMMAFPTDKIATKHSKKKFSKSVKEMPCLKGKIKPVRSKDSGNTILEKDFPGGSVIFTGSNSPVSARHDSIRFLILDDFDGFEQDVGGEGAPGDLYRKRTDSYGKRRKIYINSTPTNAGVSNIDREYQSSSQGLFCVPCPHCGEYQYLEWGGKGFDYGIKFTHDDDNQIIDIWYMCKYCKGRINETDKEKMFPKGKYIHKYPHREVRGFKVNSLYSPLGWVSWKQIAKEFLKIGKNKEKLKAWINTRLAEVFEEEGDQPDWTILKARVEPYQMLTVPNQVLMLTMGTDTQDNRLVTVVRGWGKYEESWLIYFGELFGDPQEQEVWNQHDHLLNYPFPRSDGSILYITSAMVDSGGHRTQAVYNYCRMRNPRVVAIKGASEKNKPIVGRPTKQEFNWKGEVIPNGVELWPLGTDNAKETIYSRLKLKEGPGCYHWPMGTNDDYFMQLTAEKHVTRFKKGFPVMEWVKINARNDALDTEVYAYCAAIRAGLSFINWDQLENKPQRAPKQPQRSTSSHQVARSSWMSR